MAIKMTLAEAIKEALQDDNKISKYEAKVIHELVAAAGHLNAKERDQLRHALQNDHFDDEAYQLLSDLLMKEDLQAKHKP
ncbi:MAG TPA: hypothetical protein V6C81_06770 [Planktothrix sp.]|jgi:uncharacterized membrane protein YebE (DUF533 family)